MADVTCVDGTQAGVAIVDRDGIPTLTFRFPDTDGLFGAPTDARTLAGPAAIAVSDPTVPLPCGLVAGTCAATSGLRACIDDYFANDGACGGMQARWRRSYGRCFAPRHGNGNVMTSQGLG